MRLYELNKPIIAAINGAAVGVGVTMTLAMDIRIAADVAKFGFVFARRGIVPEACSSYFLPRVVGISQALQWCYSGNVFPAQEALEGGLVKKLYPKDDLLAQARAIAEDIRDNASPVSVALIQSHDVENVRRRPSHAGTQNRFSWYLSTAADPPMQKKASILSWKNVQQNSP